MTYLLVGDVPQAVERYLADHNLDVSRVDLMAGHPERHPSDHYVVHVPAESSQAQVKTVERWLDLADHSGARCALTSGSGHTAATLDLVFHPAVTSMALLNDGDSANEVALADFTSLSRSGSGEDDLEGAVKIGRFYPFLQDLAAHRARRFESLAMPSMAPFLSTVKEAVRAMAFTSGGRTPPWDPQGPLTAARKIMGTPSLADVFRLHETTEARELLTKAPEGGGSAPHLLIRGESGSGKTMVADLVHDRLRRMAQSEAIPMVTVNCAALSERNYEHELFGCAQGAYTGIDRPVIGSLARASHGLAFLDEVGDLDPAVQRALLVFLQDGKIRPFQIVPFAGHVSIIAATNRDVPLLIERQQFRNDLNQRFMYQAEIPPLRKLEPAERERLVDFTAVSPQANSATDGLAVTHIAADAMAKLVAWDYADGNFRELQGVVHTGIAAARRRGSKILGLRDLTFTEPSSVPDRDASIVEVASVPTGPYLDVERRSDLGRLAVIHGLPVLRADETAEFVVANGTTYRWSKGPAHE